MELRGSSEDLQVHHASRQLLVAVVEVVVVREGGYPNIITSSKERKKAIRRAKQKESFSPCPLLLFSPHPTSSSPALGVFFWRMPEVEFNQHSQSGGQRGTL